MSRDSQWRNGIEGGIYLCNRLQAFGRISLGPFIGSLGRLVTGRRLPLESILLWEESLLTYFLLVYYPH